MKTTIGTLLLTFVIFLGSIQLSAQSDHQIDELPDSETFENVPSGRTVRLANGHVYRSLGTGVIIVRYNSINGDGYIRQGGRIASTHGRLFPTEEFFENIPLGNSINLANGHSYRSVGREPIRVRYNTRNGIAHVYQGNQVTPVGEAGLENLYVRGGRLH